MIRDAPIPIPVSGIRDAPIPIPVSGIGLDTTFSKVLVLVKSPPIPGTDTMF